LAESGEDEGTVLMGTGKFKPSAQGGGMRLVIDPDKTEATAVEGGPVFSGRLEATDTVHEMNLSSLVDAKIVAEAEEALNSWPSLSLAERREALPVIAASLLGELSDSSQQKDALSWVKNNRRDLLELLSTNRGQK
jgi:hypothetical protein